METKAIKKEYNIDAKGKKLGRLASEVAIILMGKNSLDYAKNKVIDVLVTVSNSSKIDISAKKLAEKNRETYSGYHSGLKVKSPEDIIRKHGHGGLIKMAVKGMLPHNKLSSRMLKNLVLND